MTKVATRTPQVCNLLTNLKATATSVSSSRVTWDQMSPTCQGLLQDPDKFLSLYITLRWPSIDGIGCPSTFDEFIKSFTESGWTMVSTSYPSCGFLQTNAWTGVTPVTEFTEYGLASGLTHHYRIWPVYMVCQPNAICDDIADAPSEVSLPLPRTLTQPSGTRLTLSVVPPSVSLRATRGKELWYSTGNGDLDISYAWTPAANAVAYVLSFDTRFYGVGGTMSNGTVTVPASSTPTYSRTFYWEAGMVVRACIGIIVDLANPPDPKKGECVETKA